MRVYKRNELDPTRLSKLRDHALGFAEEGHEDSLRVPHIDYSLHSNTAFSLCLMCPLLIDTLLLSPILMVWYCTAAINTEVSRGHSHP